MRHVLVLLAALAAAKVPLEDLKINSREFLITVFNSSGPEEPIQ